jgi:Spy/CpxP family protein refolding chaperone
MKKIILLAAGLFVFATATQAQETTERSASTANVKHERMTPEQKAQKNVDEIDRTVALTAEQKVKVKELALARITKMQELRGKHADQAELVQKEQREIRHNFKEGLKSVLTAEQQEKLKAKAQERKAGKNAASQH